MPIALKPGQLPVNELIEDIEKNPKKYSIYGATESYGASTDLINSYDIQDYKDKADFTTKPRNLVSRCRSYNNKKSSSYFESVKFAFELTLLFPLSALLPKAGVGKYLGYVFIGGPLALIGTLAAPLGGAVAWLIDAILTRSERSKIFTQISQLKGEIRAKAAELDIPLDKAPEKPASPALSQLGKPVESKGDKAKLEAKAEKKDEKDQEQDVTKKKVAADKEKPAAPPPPSTLKF